MTLVDIFLQFAGSVSIHVSHPSPGKSSIPPPQCSFRVPALPLNPFLITDALITSSSTSSSFLMFEVTWRLTSLAITSTMLPAGCLKWQVLVHPTN
ncbi:hypothetical protein Y032_0069g369 [Ancylostoma ceylanicum]|uniref:Uncharacterized protein n=1 Tax=Ancylostoma ceylanicum TaxID=53326 RepID=A0A016TYQ0_9BILA|nr:hypothetical protein Y032_0069g369 [Ancylostoma ceylanicum]